MSHPTFTVYGIPVTQGSLTPMRSKSTGRTIAKHSSVRLEGWREWVGFTALRHRPQGGFMDGPLVLVARFFLLRPKSVKRPYPTSQRDGDLDKYARAIGDALTGVLFRDDSQIVALRAEKTYSDVARVEIEVIPVDDAAVPHSDHAMERTRNGIEL